MEETIIRMKQLNDELRSVDVRTAKTMTLLAIHLFTNNDTEGLTLLNRLTDLIISEKECISENNQNVLKLIDYIKEKLS